MPVISHGMRLVRQCTFEDVELNQEIKDFRGESYILNSATPPHSPNSTGRVYLTRHDKPFRSEYFPSVVNLVWIEDKS